MEDKRRIHGVASVLVALLVSASVPASAEGLFSPYIGGTFRGASADGRVVFGGSLGFMGGGIFGIEADVAHSPDFFKTADDRDNNVTTSMVNLIVGVPVGGTGGAGVRPYVSGGVGLLRAHIASASNLLSDLSTNDFGVNLGGGVMGFMNDRIGVRGDVRYMRAFTKDEDKPFDVGLSNFDFMRATAGIVLRF